MGIKSLEQWEKGYLAGVLDSDGAILIRRIGKSYSFYCYLQFVGTFEQMVKIRALTGVDKKISVHGNRYTFQITKQDDVVVLLKRIYKFITKQMEADLVFRMRNLHDKSNSYGQKGIRPSESNLAERIQIFERYKLYKARSGGHVTNWGEFKESLSEAYETSYGNPEPSLHEAFDSLSEQDKLDVLAMLKEGAETRPEIMAR